MSGAACAAPCKNENHERRSTCVVRCGPARRRLGRQTEQNPDPTCAGSLRSSGRSCPGGRRGSERHLWRGADPHSCGLTWHARGPSACRQSKNDHSGRAHRLRSQPMSLGTTRPKRQDGRLGAGAANIPPTPLRGVRRGRPDGSSGGSGWLGPPSPARCPPGTSFGPRRRARRDRMQASR